ncbi:4749_t:CDS:2, partial [Racocetra persica]
MESPFVSAIVLVALVFWFRRFIHVGGLSLSLFHGVVLSLALPFHGWSIGIAIVYYSACASIYVLFMVCIFLWLIASFNFMNSMADGEFLR